MRRIAPLLVLVLTASCSWGAFSDYADDTPMFAFSNRGAGGRVAIATDTENNAILGAGGAPPEGAHFYTLGNGGSTPTGTPLTNNAQCELAEGDIPAGQACLPATTLSPAGVLIEEPPDRPTEKIPHPGCFALGYGRRSDSSGIDPGPIVYCTDGGLFTLDPASADSVLARAFKDRNGDAIRSLHVAMATLPSKGTGNPPLVLGSDVDERAWVYPKIEAQGKPIELVEAADTKGERYGAAVAIANSAAGRLFLVSAPGVGRAFAFTLDASDPPVPARAACLTGQKGLGEALAIGDVDLDGVDDVLTNDGGNVVVFLGRDRPAPPAAPSDPCPEWKASSIVLRCADVRGVTGCADAGFGTSIAVGDFDKNGKPDVAVGAPYATTDGVTASGAVFLFTPTVGSDNAVVDVRYLGNPQTNAAFGAAVASGNVGGQDTLAVGARGKGVSYVVWCTQLEGRPGGPRCRK